MTECEGASGSSEPDGAPSLVRSEGQDLTSLLDLHRRGVIDDEQFVLMSRQVSGTPAAESAQAHRAHAEPARAGRLRQWQGRRGGVLIAGAAALALVAGTAGWATMSDGPEGDATSLSGSAEGALSTQECHGMLDTIAEDSPDITFDELSEELSAYGCPDEILAGAEPTDAPAPRPSKTRTTPKRSPSPSRYAGLYSAYTRDVAGSGEHLLYTSASAFAAQAELVCSLPMDEMVVWMGQEIGSGAWPIEQLKTYLYNNGSVVRTACPNKVPAFIEAGEQTVFAGPDTDMDKVPDAVKAKLLEQCMAEADRTGDIAMLELCSNYI